MRHIFWNLLVQETQNCGGPTYGSNYDMTKGCVKCGTGAERIGPLIVSNLKAPMRPIFATLDGEILISDYFVEILKGRGINSFSDVVSKRDRKTLPYKVLDSQEILPPFDISSSGYKIYKKRQCAMCKRDAYFYIPHIVLELHYSNVRNDMLKKDIFHTYERCGFSYIRDPFSNSAFASPFTIISDKFKSIIEEYKAVKGIEFEPVYFD